MVASVTPANRKCVSHPPNTQLQATTTPVRSSSVKRSKKRTPHPVQEDPLPPVPPQPAVPSPPPFHPPPTAASTLPAEVTAAVQQAAGSGAHVTFHYIVNNHYYGGPPHSNKISSRVRVPHLRLASQGKAPFRASPRVRSPRLNPLVGELRN